MQKRKHATNINHQEQNGRINTRRKQNHREMERIFRRTVGNIGE